MRKWEDVYVWLKQLVPGMRLSRIKTLSALVAGAMRMRGVGVLSLGRAMSGPTAAKHRIKRVWRFFRNPAVESLEVSKALFERIMPRKGSIVILCDWTDIDPFQQLVLWFPPVVFQNLYWSHKIFAHFLQLTHPVRNHSFRKSCRLLRQ